MSMISSTLALDMDAAVSSGTGLFITSAMLGFCLKSWFPGVGGCIARWEILGVAFPRVAKSVLMDRSRTFLLGVDDDAVDGAGDELRLGVDFESARCS
jgi:hypothetical protein